jgi:hypothetical protein
MRGTPAHAAQDREPSFDLRKRGLWGIANPHFLREQPFQLLLLPPKGVNDIDGTLCHFRPPKPDRRRALELLASCLDGCTEAIMLAHGFSKIALNYRSRSQPCAEPFTARIGLLPTAGCS